MCLCGDTSMSMVPLTGKIDTPNQYLNPVPSPWYLVKGHIRQWHGQLWTLTPDLCIPVAVRKLGSLHSGAKSTPEPCLPEDIGRAQNRL